MCVNLLNNFTSSKHAYQLNTHSKFVIWKLLLQQLNQGALSNTGGSTNDYGTASAVGHFAVSRQTRWWACSAGSVLRHTPLASSFGRSTTLDFPSWEDSKRFVDRPCLRITDCYTARLATAVGLR